MSSTASFLGECASNITTSFPPKVYFKDNFHKNLHIIEHKEQSYSFISDTKEMTRLLPGDEELETETGFWLG